LCDPVTTNFYAINLNDFDEAIVKRMMLAAPETVAASVAGSHPDNALSALQFQIHNDLRVQHPEWIRPDGECPICDFYEARLAQLLEGYAHSASDEYAAAIHRTLQEAVTVNQLPAV
jgi:hypothetical protein